MDWALLATATVSFSLAADEAGASLPVCSDFKTNQLRPLPLPALVCDAGQPRRWRRGGPATLRGMRASDYREFVFKEDCIL